ncbi:MAG: oxalate/formate MFS antiporter [Acidobacteriota bacterium]|nr:oxalate/formate MFS antiporter [Acidobacteriota bacterium]
MTNRWIQLGASLLGMIMIANLQYAWTLFVTPLQQSTGWKLSAIQWAFTLFIVFETWVMPLEGWLIDRLGPRIFISIAAVLCTIGWSGLAYARTLPELYTLYAIAGVGAAFVYSGSMATGLKWFPDKRGLAAGIIAGGFGSGSALFIPIISQIIRADGYRTAFLYTGVFQGILIFCAAQLMRNPPPHMTVPPAPKTSRLRVSHASEQFNTLEMLRTPHFYILYLMATMMGIGGLMVTAQAAPVAATLNIGLTALTVAQSLGRVGNGAGRVFWGWVSDHLGREKTMFIAFTLQAGCLLSVLTLGAWSGTWFIVTLFCVYFTWGEVYVLFPSAVADYFGAKNCTSNYSLMYTSKGVASIVAGGIAALLFERFGSWSAAFYGSAALALCSALMAIGIHSLPLPSKNAQVVDTQVII